MKKYRIKYLKTSEEFIIEVEENEDFRFQVKVNEYELVQLMNVKERKKDEDSSTSFSFELTLSRFDWDDDTRAIVKDLFEHYWFSFRLLTLVKRQQHLRKLGRVESSWVSVRKRDTNNIFGRPVGSKKTKELSAEEQERLAYLKANFESIAHRCVVHDWFDEYVALYRDVYPEMSKKEILKKYSVEKNRVRVL